MMGEVLSVIRALAGEGITMPEMFPPASLVLLSWMVCQYSHRFQNGNNQMNLYL